MKRPKKVALIVVVGLALVAAVAIYFLIPKITPTQRATEGARQTKYREILAELGELSSSQTASTSTTAVLPNDILENEGEYRAALEKYGVLPEQILATNDFTTLNRSVILPSPKVDFTFSLAETLTKTLSNRKPPTNALPVYSFLTDFSPDYISNLAKNLGTDEKYTTKDTATGDIYFSDFDQKTTSSSTDADRRLAIFNSSSGKLKYVFTKPQGTSTSTEPIKIAQEFLGQNEAFAPYILNLDYSEAASYERKDTPGVTYVTFHRSWDPLPILNLTALHNLSKLDSSRAATVSDAVNLATNLPDDNIVNTSDKTDGYSRNEEYNTIVVAVSQNKVTGIKFNLRPLDSTALAASLISPSEAYAKAKTGEFYQMWLVPDGVGWIDPQKIYPQNFARAEEATINAVYLAYSENPGNQRQKYFQPLYVFRGQAKLNSGYNVNFNFVVPAYNKDIFAESPLTVGAEKGQIGLEDFKATNIAEEKKDESKMSGSELAGEEVVPGGIPESEKGDSSSCFRFFDQIIEQGPGETVGIRNSLPFGLTLLSGSTNFQENNCLPTPGQSFSDGDQRILTGGSTCFTCNIAGRPNQLNRAPYQ